MEDDEPNSGAEGQEPEAPSSQADDPNANTLEELRKKNSEVAREAQGLRKRLKESQDAAAAIEAEKKALAESLTSAQQAQAQVDGSLKQARVSNAILQASFELGVDPALAQQLNLGSFEFDEAGNPVGIKDKLTAMVEKWPSLKAGTAVPPPTPPPNPSPTNPGGDRKGLTLEDVKAMSQEQVLARYDEVSALLRGGK